MEKINEALQASKQERDSIKAQIYDANKRLTELEGIIAALSHSLDLLKEDKEE